MITNKKISKDSLVYLESDNEGFMVGLKGGSKEALEISTIRGMS